MGQRGASYHEVRELVVGRLGVGIYGNRFCELLAAEKKPRVRTLLALLSATTPAAACPASCAVRFLSGENWRVVVNLRAR